MAHYGREDRVLGFRSLDTYEDMWKRDGRLEGCAWIICESELPSTHCDVMGVGAMVTLCSFYWRLFCGCSNVNRIVLGIMWCIVSFYGTRN